MAVLLLALFSLPYTDAIVLRGNGIVKNVSSHGMEEKQTHDLSEKQPGLVAIKGRADTLPPKCPAHVSENSPFWFEPAISDGVHIVKEYYRPVTNLERLNSIRGLLVRTKQHFNELGVPYLLYAGSALGQQRCKDVLPWDVDCDVIIWSVDVPKISPRHFDSQYVLSDKRGLGATSSSTSYIPFSMVDKTTGLYCDVFTIYHDQQTQQVWSPWPWGNSYCSHLVTESYFSNPTWNGKCYKYNAAILSPSVPCVLHGTTYDCYQNQPAYLAEFYGPSWSVPNVSTQFVRGWRRFD